MLEIISILAVVTVIVFISVVMSLPDEFRITRTLTVNAPAAAAFAKVNELRQWHDWSPWAKLDPNSTVAFDGPEAGVGAIMSWAGNNKVGVGSLTITDSRPDEGIQFRLDFQKPFKGSNTAEFTFKAEDGQTTVTWGTAGKNNFIGKAMILLGNCEQKTGGAMERGLANLKALVEATAA